MNTEDNDNKIACLLTIYRKGTWTIFLVEEKKCEKNSSLLHNNVLYSVFSSVIYDRACNLYEHVVCARTRLHCFLIETYDISIVSFAQHSKYRIHVKLLFYMLMLCPRFYYDYDIVFIR